VLMDEGLLEVEEYSKFKEKMRYVGKPRVTP
jgi:hypothetical protein